MARFTADNLTSLSVKEVKQICTDLGLTPAFRKAACIEQILDYQDAQEIPDWQKEEIALEVDALQAAQEFSAKVKEIALTDAEITVISEAILAPTCADCPYFQKFDPNGRGWCHCFEHMARQDHLATSSCPAKPEEIAQAESLDIELATATFNIAPEEIIDNGDGSFQVLSGDATRYYTVRGDRCSCRAGQHRKPCKHLGKVRDLVVVTQVEELEAYLEAQVIEQWDIVEIVSPVYGAHLVGVQAKVADIFPDDLNLLPLTGGRAHMVAPEHVRLVSKAPRKVEVARPLTAENWMAGVKFINRATREYQYGRAINTLTGYGSYQLATR
jgi:hypothetical protein